MPRFHFNIYDGIISIDQDGTELPDVHAALREALILAGAVIEETAKLSALGEEWRMEVTDDADLLLFRLDFTIVGSPATTSLRQPQS